MSTLGGIHTTYNDENDEEVTSRYRSLSDPQGLHTKQTPKQKNLLFEQLVRFKKEADAKKTVFMR